MKTYFRRVAKYVIQFTVLLLIMIGIMMVFSKGQKVNLFEVLFTQRGLMLWAVMLLFTLTYPFFGFVKRTLTFDATKNMEDVDKVMEMCGFVKIDTQNDQMIYRAKSVAKKIMLLYEDTIIIATDKDGVSSIEGARKEVVKASMRFSTFIN